MNYNSLKCDPLTAFVYQLNESVVLSSIRTGVTGSHASGGNTAGLARRSATTHDRGRLLTDACAAVQAFDEDSDDCLRESSLLFLLLMLGTVWLGLSLYNFTKTSVPAILLCGPPPLVNEISRASFCKLYDTIPRETFKF